MSTATAPEATRLPTPPLWQGALAGLLATAVALGAGELVAGLSLRMASPVIAVGEVVVDGVPQPVKQFAIDTFGAADKIALIVGTIVIAAVVGAGLGVLARRRPLLGAALVGAFGLVGAAAALRGTIGGPLAPVPSLLAGVVGFAAVLLLIRRSGRADAAAAPRTDGPRMRAGAGDRRSFLKLSGGVALGATAMAVGGRALAGRSTAAGAREAVAFPGAARPLAPLPTGTELGVDGIAPFITPAADFYRVDTALVVPQVQPATWSLRIDGMVQRPFSLTYDELLSRDLVEADITLTCVSNTVGGNLVGNARWQGVRLADLLEEAGVEMRADQIVGRSVDGYTCGFPTPAAFDRDALVAVGMNGEPLPIERGFPARLIVPGLYGYVSATKWLAEIELTRFDEFDQYWVPRGWDAKAPIKTQARIDVPRSFASVEAGTVDVGGVAWAQTKGISAVEIRIDDGDWEPTELGDVPGEDTWRQWRYRWDASPGSHRITVRAIDGDGELQTDERAEPFPNGASGWQTLFATVT